MVFRFLLFLFVLENIHEHYGTFWNHLGEASHLKLSDHNICVCIEKRNYQYFFFYKKERKKISRAVLHLTLYSN